MSRAAHLSPSGGAGGGGRASINLSLPMKEQRKPHAATSPPAVELEGTGELKGLLLPYKHVYRAAVHGPVFADLVLKETAIRLLDILRQVGIEHERGDLCVRDLRAILDLDILALGRWWRISLDERQHHLVELGCAHLRCAVLIDLLCELQHLEDALLGEG